LDGGLPAITCVYEQNLLKWFDYTSKQ